MKQRVISAIVALMIVIPMIIAGGKIFCVGASILGLIGFIELLNAKDKKKKLPFLIKILSIVCFLLLLINNWSLNGKLFVADYKRIPFIILLLVTPIVFYNKSKEYDIEDALFLLGGVLFLGVGFNQLIGIRLLDVKYLVYLLLITIFTDTFAYIVGRLVGKHKMSPTVSPNKTWEGFFGGLVFGTFISTVYYISAFNYNRNIFLLVCVTALLSIIGALGDLTFSSIKRHFGVKDFGKIMPGHGGILDRLDSILYVVLAFGILISIF